MISYFQRVFSLLIFFYTTKTRKALKSTYHVRAILPAGLVTSASYAKQRNEETYFCDYETLSCFLCFCGYPF